MESKMIEALKLVLPLIQQITGEDFQLSLCDRETALETWEARTFKLPGAIPGLKLSWDNPGQVDMLNAMQNNEQKISSDYERQSFSTDNNDFSGTFRCLLCAFKIIRKQRYERIFYRSFIL